MIKLCKKKLGFFMEKQKLIELIKQEKNEKNIKILAHTYQSPDIIDLADVTGDSYMLAKAAQKLDCETVLMCGVRFMAETVKILSPEKKVLLSAEGATCPMALQIEPRQVVDFKKEHPDYTVCAYINTTAELKAVSDVCVTSSSAVRIIERMDAENILFIPDKNLGRYVQMKVKGKNFAFFDGCCPVHNSITAADVINEKSKHPGALFAVHPECRPEVAELADFVGSTSAIIDYALNTDSDVIIGTERGVVDYLKIKHPSRNFYQLREDLLVCRDMKMTTLEEVYSAVTGNGTVIEMDENLRLAAKRPLDNMLKYGG